MCGICGFSGDANKSLLVKMGNSIYHRGPDQEGLYSDGKMNMCSRRLSIIDLDTGIQPTYNNSKTMWAVWNGEIYNHQELRKTLEEKGHTFYSDHSDTEVMLHMYEEYGIDFVNKLNGMFAIAIWDKRTESLIIIRDRMGVKPLFYAIVDGIIIFSSEIKSILLHPLIKKELNYDAIYHYFSFKNITPPETAFKGIFELLPGQIGVFNNKDFNTYKYWNINFLNQSSDTFEEAKEKISALIIDATLKRLVSDVEIGSFLSGGLDSSLVTSIIAKHANSKLKTFSMGYEISEKAVYKKDLDIKCARLMSDLFNTDHTEYILKPQEVLDSMDDVIKSFDQPFSGVTSTYFLSKIISKYVKVAVSGDGADELFGSYLSHRLASPLSYYSSMMKKNSSLLSLDTSRLAPFENNIDYLNELYNKTNAELPALFYELLQIKDDEKRNMLSNSFKKNISNGLNTKEVINLLCKTKVSDDPLNATLEYDWNVLLPNQVLAFVDFLSMANSLEIRSPFLDYRLVEYVASLPGNYKINNGNTKHILKCVAEKFLPNEVIYRPKEGFVLPVYDWLKVEFKAYTTDILSEDSIKKYNILEPCWINNLLHEYYSDPYKNVNKSSLIWNLIMFQNWCRLYL